MKKLKEVAKKVEMEATIVEEDDGLIALLGKNICIHAMNYNYSGKLVGVNTACIRLDMGQVVFDIGPYTSPAMKNAEYVNKKILYVNISAIEAFWEI